MSNKMETPPIRLGDKEAIKRISVKGRKGEDIFQGNRLQHQSIFVLLVAKHIGQRQVQTEFTKLHFDLQVPAGGEA